MEKEFIPPTSQELQLRKALSGLTEDDARVLRLIAPLIAHEIPGIVDQFYESLQQYAPLRAIVAEHTTIERLKATFRTYCSELFGGEYDQDYLTKRVQVGLTHTRVGLPLVWYQGLHLFLREAIIARVNKIAERDSTLDVLKVRVAIDRLMSLDKLLANDAYVVSYTAKLQAQTDRANEATRAKSMFLAAASHELRTPLSAIIGFSDMILRNSDALPQKIKKYSEAILRNGQNLLAIINDLLDLSKVESGKWEVRLAPTDVASILAELAADAKRLVGSRPVQVKRAFTDSELKKVVCDGQKVRQIVLNLITNAAKFTESGEIEIAATLASHQLEISVRDTGPGLDESEAVEVFEEFRQLKQSNQTGSGLGLSISQNLAKLMGGRLVVHSSKGAGSTFTLVLPTQS